MTLVLIFAFVLGAVVGSFLNVCIIRFGTGKTILGRSACMVCARQLSWWELIPIGSFAALRGKCASCKTKLSKQYIIVEILAGCITAFFAYQYILRDGSGFTLALFGFSVVIWSFLLMIAVYDVYHKAIPNIFVGWFIGVSLVLAVFEAVHEGSWHLLGGHIIAALLLSAFFFLIWGLSRGRAMGLGDGILAFGIGLYLGIPQGLSGIAFGFWIGALYAVGRILYERMGTREFQSGGKRITMKSEVPFAPFLILGAFIALAFHSDVFHILFFFT